MSNQPASRGLEAWNAAMQAFHRTVLEVAVTPGAQRHLLAAGGRFFNRMPSSPDQDWKGMMQLPATAEAFAAAFQQDREQLHGTRYFADAAIKGQYEAALNAAQEAFAEALEPWVSRAQKNPELLTLDAFHAAHEAFCRAVKESALGYAQQETLLWHADEQLFHSMTWQDYKQPRTLQTLETCFAEFRREMRPGKYREMPAATAVVCRQAMNRALAAAREQSVAGPSR